MAVLNYVWIEWRLSPRIIVVESPYTNITIQDLVDTLRHQEALLTAIDDPKLLNASGKEDLGGGTSVGITAELQNARLMFEARSTPISTGNTCSVANSAGTKVICTGATFITDGTVVGDVVFNNTTNSMGTITDIPSEDIILCFPLDGGSRNDFQIGDDIEVYENAQCSVTGGNLVAIDENALAIEPIFQSPFVQVVRASSSSATLQEADTDTIASTIAGAVWDEDLSTHTVQKSASTALRSVVYRVGTVTLDTASGTAGVGFPIGSHFQPSSNLADALTIMGYGNVDTLILNTSVTIGAAQDISKLLLKTIGRMGIDVVLDAGCTANQTTFRNVNLFGEFSGACTTLVEDCSIGTLANFQGVMNNVAFNQGSEISFSTWATIIQGTAGGEPTNEVEFAVNGAILNISQWTGNLKLTNKTGVNRTIVNCSSGNIIIDSSCVAGTIQLLGTGYLEADNSGAGCTVDTEGFISNEFIAETVWDNAAAGRVLGLLQENQYLDKTTYDTYNGQKLLTAGRIRLYSDDASVGTDNNCTASYLVTATWTNDEMDTYKVVKS